MSTADHRSQTSARSRFRSNIFATRGNEIQTKQRQTRKNGTKRAQISQKEVLKLYTTGAVRRSVPRHFPQDTDITRCMLVRLRRNDLSDPEASSSGYMTNKLCS